MNIKNLTEEQANELDFQLGNMKRVNPSLWWAAYQQNTNIPEPTEPELLQRIGELENKIESLTMKLEHIFGNHLLFNGRFIDFTPKP